MFTVHFHKNVNNNLQINALSVYLLYIYRYSYMFRPDRAIFRELYTVKCDLILKQYAVDIQ
jgi:hypothetical protein